ncbi:MAG TPA: hydroxymethylbilane synthase [Alphaproteobacteria bacterium]|nr:hydroxymethylbilane synthase [Alphaproteobacteria bacterium]
MASPLLRIGTRGSPMALVQAHCVAEALRAAHPALADPDAIAVTVIRTTGDRVQDRTLAEIGGKGLFTKEIDEALLSGAIDMAAHSVKDVPTWLPPALTLAGILPRDDPRDAFVSLTAESLEALPAGAVIGTASLRRQAQILHRHPRLKVVPFRGNAGTRLRKLAEGQADATILGIAGLVRIDEAKAARRVLSPEEMLPAVGQGAIGVTIRSDDGQARGWLAAINHGPSVTCIAAERALLAELDGSCRTPIAGLAEIDAAGRLRLRGLVATPDGRALHEHEIEGAVADAVRLGTEAGKALKARAGAAFLATLG